MCFRLNELEMCVEMNVIGWHSKHIGWTNRVSELIKDGLLEVVAPMGELITRLG